MHAHSLRRSSAAVLSPFLTNGFWAFNWTQSQSKNLIQPITSYTAYALYLPDDSGFVADLWQIQCGLEISDGHTNLEILFCGKDQNNLASLEVGVLAGLKGVCARRVQGVTDKISQSSEQTSEMHSESLSTKTESMTKTVAADSDMWSCQLLRNSVCVPGSSRMENVRWRRAWFGVGCGARVGMRVESVEEEVEGGG